jgi:hypothetical protein
MERTKEKSHDGREDVRVEFREAASEDVIIVTYIDLVELPARFDAHTVLDLKGGQWQVRRAEPSHAEQWSDRGLTLWLERITSEDEPDSAELIEDDFLFTPPTTAKELPPLTRDCTDDPLELYAADWRQNEILHRSQRAAVRREFDAIRRTPPGATHPRPMIKGLERAPTHAELRRHMDGIPFDGVVLLRDGQWQQVERGFAFETPTGTIFYGCADASGEVSILGLHLWADPEALFADLIRLGRRLAPHDHLFISWCSSSVATLAEVGVGRQIAE